MEDSIMMDTEESPENSDEEKERKDYFMIFKMMEHHVNLLKLMKRIKITDQEEEIEEYYNVTVYRVLPYPPNTKDVKDFFVQRN
jgi:hypothetical protein